MDKEVNNSNKGDNIQLTLPNKKKRLANIELLRMLSMFMVLMTL